MKAKIETAVKWTFLTLIIIIALDWGETLLN